MVQFVTASRWLTFLIVILVVVVAKVSSQAETPCTAKYDDCDFYRCLENKFNCGDNGYPIAYGLKYCNKFNNAKSSFSDFGQKWVMQTTHCLQRELENLDLTNCDNLRNYAIRSHPSCYANEVASFCDLKLFDKLRIVGIIENFDASFFHQVGKVLGLCFRHWKTQFQVG